MTVLLIALIVISGIIVISIVSSRQWQKRLRGYTGTPLEEFVSYFAAQGVPRSVSEKVYFSFKEKARSKEFMPSPEMSIKEVFEQADEDTEDDAREILGALGIPEPPESPLEYREGHKVKTVADLVLWTDWARRRQSGSLGNL